jgi:hypothetical protein
VSREELGTAPVVEVARGRSGADAWWPGVGAPRPGQGATVPEPGQGATVPEPGQGATVPEPSGAEAAPAPAWHGRGRRRHRLLRQLARRGPAASGLVLALAAGLVIGRLGGGWWAATADTTSGAGADLDPMAAAVVLDGDFVVATPGRTVVEFRVRVTNVGPVPLVVLGGTDSVSAARIVRVTPRLTVQPGAGADAVVRADVGCSSPQPLRLPGLDLERPDRRTVTIPVEGDGRVLVRLCQGRARAPHVVDLVAAGPDGARLRLVVRSPSGRTTLVTGVRAASVPIGGRPLPATVDAQDRTIWLDPPPRCAPEWARGGLPRALDLDVNAGAPATVTLDTGYALANWLRAGPCARVTP